MVKFGDVFRHNEKEYVFLAQVDDIIYAAVMLSHELTQKVKTRYEKIVQSNNAKVKDNVLYCFVILDSEPFKDRMAHFANTDGNSFDLTFDTIGSLNEHDIKAIKQEILAENIAVPIRLKEIVKTI